jgi:hypothetical protein
MSDLINNKQIGQLYTLVVRRERKERKNKQTIDHRQQFKHYLSIRATPWEKGHGCAFS